MGCRAIPGPAASRRPINECKSGAHRSRWAPPHFAARTRNKAAKRIAKKGARPKGLGKSTREKRLGKRRLGKRTGTIKNGKRTGTLREREKNGKRTGTFSRSGREREKAGKGQALLKLALLRLHFSALARGLGKRARVGKRTGSGKGKRSGKGNGREKDRHFDGKREKDRHFCGTDAGKEGREKDKGEGKGQALLRDGHFCGTDVREKDVREKDRHFCVSSGKGQALSRALFRRRGKRTGTFEIPGKGQALLKLALLRLHFSALARALWLPGSGFQAVRNVPQQDVSPTMRAQAEKMGALRSLQKRRSFTGSAPPAIFWSRFGPRALAGWIVSAR